MIQLIQRRKPIAPVYLTKLGRLFCGDVLTVLKSLPSESVQCCVTSPPYWGLRDYGTGTWVGGDQNCNHKPLVLSRSTRPKGKLAGSTQHIDEGTVQKKVCHCGAVRVDKQIGLEDTPQEYAIKMVELFREVLRVLKSNGTLWLNLGDSYTGGGRAGRDGQAYGGLKAQNRCNAKVKWGQPTGKIDGLKPKDLVGVPWMIAFALRESGWYLRQDIIWEKPNPMPESVTDRCTKAHEYIFLMSKSGKYYFDQDSIREKTGRESSAEEYEKNLGEDWQKGRDRKNEDLKMGMMRMKNKPEPATHPNGRNKRSVWSIVSESYPEAHFATFPTKLIEPCIKAGSKKGDIVLDPFMGSGTTGYVCEILDRQWIGIELNPKYCDLARKRINQEALKPKLF